MIECVVVCVNYADFLAWTLPYNRNHFDNMVVVTTPQDKATQKLCEFWHIQCIKSEVCYENDAPFNKAKMINVGLENLTGSDWVVHIDADIFLPPKFRQIIDSIKLDKDSVYGIDRLMCDNFTDWLKYIVSPRIINENDIYVHLDRFKIGTRIAKMQEGYGGWIPIGFFQMWNQGNKKMIYPPEHTTAGRSDLLFSIQFPRDKRMFLPEIVGIHLSTPIDKMGANWAGRTTRKFGEEIIEKEAIDTYYI